MSGSIISMLVVIIAFFGMVWWVFKPSNKERFSDYANIPLEDDAPEAASEDAAAGKGESARKGESA
ncbi:MAG: cbb3-type cytochrome c oxidase subunit 3 [Gammaproteobacteria bacterium]|nr:cbb3-type cytochrome c oxidase subunit 3 [Gammaproteobacteria bacterium]